ncbi:MAG: adenylosuccinate lyase, partial [Thermoproteota archaeon]
RKALEEALEGAQRVSAEDVYREEGRLGHDVAALVFLMGRHGGAEAARWLHYGATSYDIVDNAWSLLVRDALALVKRRLRRVVEKLSELADRYRGTPMPGRTHGQHATPITLGFKLANYVYELARSYERICCAEKRVLRVKLGGATGTMAAWKGYGLELRRRLAEKLGFEPHPIATQVAPRDGLAELASALAILASVLDRFALEVRELSRPEIGELWEDRGRAIGSSAMPQKSNPVTAERICGLARVARALVHVFLENVVLWHERDLTNSSSERIAIPHLFLTVDQMLLDTERLLERLRVDEDRMRRNLYLTKATTTTEALMNKLIEAGLSREKAYALAREAAAKALREGTMLWEAAKAIPEVAERLGNVDLEEALKPENYVGEAARLVDEALSYARKAVSSC